MYNVYLHKNEVPSRTQFELAFNLSSREFINDSLYQKFKTQNLSQTTSTNFNFMGIKMKNFLPLTLSSSRVVSRYIYIIFASIPDLQGFQVIQWAK